MKRIHRPNRRTATTRTAGLALLVVLLCAGCTQTFDVKVDAIHDPSVAGGHSYRIEPLDPALAEDELEYARAANLVKSALSGKGMYEAPDPEQAEVVVGVDYGRGSPRTEYRTRADPMMSGSVAMGVPMRRGGMVGGYPSVAGRPVVIIDDSPKLEAERVYEKYLSLVARKAKSEEGDRPTGPEIWRVTVTVQDKETNVQKVLPVMVGAATDYIGRDTGTQEKIRVNEKAEVVKFVKEGP